MVNFKCPVCDGPMVHSRLRGYHCHNESHNQTVREIDLDLPLDLPGFAKGGIIPPHKPFIIGDGAWQREYRIYLSPSPAVDGQQQNDDDGRDDQNCDGDSSADL